MSVQNTHRSYVGIAKETTKGTAVTPTVFIPVIASTLKPVDKYGALYDEGLRGSLVKNYNYIQGRGNSTFDFGGAAFADTIGFPIAGLLGEDVVQVQHRMSTLLLLKTQLQQQQTLSQLPLQ